MPEFLYYQHEKKELHHGLQARKSCRLIGGTLLAAPLHGTRPKRDRHVKPHTFHTTSSLAIRDGYRHEQPRQHSFLK